MREYTVRDVQDKADSVVKVYRTLTFTPPQLGQLVHYVTTGNRSPGEPSHTIAYDHEVQSSQRSELEVLKVRPGLERKGREDLGGAMDVRVPAAEKGACCAGRSSARRSPSPELHARNGVPLPSSPSYGSLQAVHTRWANLPCAY